MNQIPQAKQKAVIYGRVSTNEIRQNIDNQIEPLKKFCESLGFELVKVYGDYVTGSTANRPQFQEMLKGAENREFDTILIWSLDRFSREGILNTLSYLKRLKEYKVGLRSLNESWLDTSDSGMGQLLLAIFSWVAEQERKRISDRVKAGLQKAKGTGKRGKDRKKRKNFGYLYRYIKLRQEQDQKKGIVRPIEHYQKTPNK